MEKIALKLGLNKDVTEKVILASIDKLQKDYKAQCEVGVEASKEILDLKEKLTTYHEAKTSAEGKVKKLTEDSEASADLQDKIDELNGIITDKDAIIKSLEGNIEQLKTQKARGSISKAKRNEKVKEFFKAHPEVKEIFATEDGTMFTEISRAQDHQRTIGGLVHTYKQK